MGEFSVEAFCGKPCAEGRVIAFIDGSSGTYPSTFASESATVSTSLMIAAAT
jgi:hypothetical protein